jgi:hypothetical protein
MAFLYRTTHQEKYKKACEKIYSDYGWKLALVVRV